MGYYGTKLNELVGRKVTKISFSQDYLRFETESGHTYTFTVSGDCCSSSYFYDFYGVQNLLKNGPVTEVKEVELAPADLKQEDGDCIAVYGFQLTTESPEFGPVTSVFSFRNRSNGYYGGSLEDSTSEAEIPEITVDVVEVK